MLIMLEQFARSVHFVNDDSYAPDVYLLVIPQWFHDLRSHVVFTAAVGFGFVGFEVDDTCHAEIDESCFNLTLIFDIVEIWLMEENDVGRFDISVIDAASLIWVDNLIGIDIDLFVILDLDVFLEQMAVEIVYVVVKTVYPLQKLSEDAPIEIYVLIVSVFIQ